MKKLILTLVLATAAAFSYGQGTVGFANGTLTRFTLVDDATGLSAQVPVGTAVSYGLFWSTSQGGTYTLVQPLGTQGTTVGIMTVASGGAYQIPGTDPGQVVWLQVKGWSSSYGNDWAAAQRDYEAKVAGTIWGQTDIRQLASTGLGPSTGPGAVIWQGSTGTNPNRFTPLVLHVAVPEPSTIALGVIGLGSLLLFRRRQAK